MTQERPNGFILAEGLHFRHRTLANETVVINHVSPQMIVVKELMDGSVHQLPRSDFLRLYSKGTIYPLTEIDAERSMSVKRPVGAEDPIPPVTGLVQDKSEAEQEQGRKILAYREILLAEFNSLRPTPRLNKRVKEIALERGDKKAIGPWTIYKYDVSIRAAGGDVAVAFPCYSNRGAPGQHRINEVAWNALKGTLEEVRKSKGRVLYSDVSDLVEEKIVAQKGNDAPKFMPVMSTIVRHTNMAMSSRERAVRNKGDKQAKREYREWLKRGRATAPLQRFECDDKNTGIFGVCAISGLPVGRIWQTVCLDEFSEMSMGHVVSGRAPNTWTAIGSLVNAILPKDRSLPALKDVKSEIPFSGLPLRAIFDNALQNHARAIDAAIVDMCGIGTIYAQPYTPTEKPNIENFNGRTVREFLADLPGFVGPKLSRDFLKDAYDRAVLSIQEYDRLYSIWVYDVYANKAGADGLTPMQRWSEGMLGRTPRYPIDVLKLRVAAMPIAMRKLRPEQILFHGLVYTHDGLKRLIEQGFLGKDVVLKYDPADLSKIWFKDPLCRDGEWYPAESNHLEYTFGLTMYQHRAVKRIAWHNKIKNPNRPQYLKYKNELRAWVLKMRYSTRMDERREAQILTLGDETVVVEHTLQVGELEKTLDDLEKDVEADLVRYEKQLHQDLNEDMWKLEE